MRTRIKSFLIIILLLLATSVQGFQTLPPDMFKPQPSKTARFFSLVWECKWRVSCYQKLGAFAQLATSNILSAFPTTYNNNLAITIETGTTSVASITTLGNLASVGTLTTGSLGSGFTTVVVARGGTGSTTLSSNQILLGNGTGNIGTVVGWGTSGQFLQSNGGVLAPTWATSAIDQGAAYTWTAASSTFVYGINVGFSTTTNATTTNLFVSGTASTTRLIAGALGVGLSTTTQRNFQVAGDVEIDGKCSGCTGADNFSRGTFSRTNGDGTGTQDITHSMNGIPRLIVIHGVDDAGGTDNDLMMSEGSATSTVSQSAIAATVAPSGASVSTAISTSTYIILMTNNAGIDAGKARLSAVADQTFTITWDVAITATGYFTWEAFR